jgi:hypothetical protein
MDDFKVVFYIVVAIVWVIYNNYKKISETAKKRDPSKPFGDIITENWPKETFAPQTQELPKKQKPVRVLKSVTDDSFKRKTVALKREPLRKDRMSGNYKFPQTISTLIEGGNLQPSKLVHFEDGAEDTSPYNQMADEIRNANFKQGIIIAEVLQRPYI